MVVKNIIAEDMPFTKSIFEQFWRSYCKKTIFVVFHFLKFLPICMSCESCMLINFETHISCDADDLFTTRGGMKQVGLEA